MRLPIPAKEMFPGIVGHVVRTFGPYTEAHPVAIAGQFVVAFGNAVGRQPHFYVGETRHGLNEYLTIVGRTSRARKGDSGHVALRPFREAAPEWLEKRRMSGLSSGEGLIHAVRDEMREVDRKGNEVVIPGVEDKRLLVMETEFSNPLKQFRREGNILSNVLRDAWDNQYTLGTLTKNSPTRATGAHISIIGHATVEDLREYLSAVEIANGLGNRFMFVATERAKRLPNPGRPPAARVERLGRQLKARIEDAAACEMMRRTRSAERLWAATYEALTADQPGLVGSLLARAEAHVARLSALFALFDGKNQITEQHLMSALALWDYSAASTRLIFAGRSGNDAADRIRSELLPGQSMALSALREQVFANHISAARLGDALRLLHQLGEVTFGETKTAGRTATVVTRISPGAGEAGAENEHGAVCEASR